jgi:release factor family 10
VPLPDGAYLSSRPYIRPLVRTLDEHDRFVLAILSHADNRFFISQIGLVDEIFRVTSDHHRAILADRPARDRRDEIVTEAIRIEARILGHVAEVLAEQFHRRHVVLSGPDDLRAAVIDTLQKRLPPRVGDEFAVEFHVGPREVAIAAEPALRAIEEREELATLQRMIDAEPRAVAWGEGPTLAALRDGRVMILAVDDMLAKAGSRCTMCQSLYDADPIDLPGLRQQRDRGGRGRRRVGDRAGAGAESGAGDRGSAAAPRLMSGRGQLAALLRW